MSICENDRAVLNTIFNPLMPLGEMFTDKFMSPEIDADKIEVGDADDEDVQQAKRLELKGVELAESGDLIAALDAFSHAIQIAPQSPSGYNNRAQVFRIQGNNTAALIDLNKAIDLSNGGRGKTGSQALCQRALLMQKSGKRQEAVRDFTTAARNGNHFAKSQLVKLNPYAALCNQMLSIAMTTLNEPAHKK